jgi:DNA-binding transcriptional regulator GbsR (MarR family)
MELIEARERFLENWARMGCQWGISKSMAKVHAFLLIQPDKVCAETIMDALDLSRGSVNTHLNTLLDWGLVYKREKEGHRKDFFVAEKDLWTVFRQILTHRKKKELEPLLATLEELSHVNCEQEEGREFVRMVRELKRVTSQADSALDTLAKSESSWFDNPFFKMIR